MGKRRHRPPPPPDAGRIAGQQYDWNRRAGQDTADLNRINQTNPFGSLQWTQGPDGRWSQDVSLNPGDQANLDRYRGLLGGLYGNVQGFDASTLPGLRSGGPNLRQLDTGGPQFTWSDRATVGGLLGGLPGISQDVTTGRARYVQNPDQALAARRGDLASLRGDRSTLAGLRALPGREGYGAEIDRIEQAQYQRGENLLRPQFDREQERLDTMLANRGIPIGSEGYRDAYGDFRRDRANQLENLALSSVLAGSREHQRLSDLDRAVRAQQFGERNRMFDEGLGLFGAGGQVFQEGQQLNQFEADERQRLFNRQLAFRQQQAAEQDQALAQQLAAQGFVSDQDLARNRFASDQTERDFGRTLSANQFDAGRYDQGFAQDLARRQQMAQEQQIPLQQLLAMQSAGAPAGVPQFNPFGQIGINAPNMQNLAMNQYNQQYQQWQQQQQDRMAGLGGLLSLGLNFLPGGGLAGLFGGGGMPNQIFNMGGFRPSPYMVPGGGFGGAIGQGLYGGGMPA